MTSDNRNPSATKEQTRVQEALERVTAAERNAANSRAAETSLAEAVNEAHTKVAATTSALRDAVEALAKAKEDTKKAQQQAKQATGDAEKTIQAQAKADRDKDRTEEKLGKLEARSQKSEKQPNPSDQVAIDRARTEANESAERSKSFEAEASRAKAAADLADRDLQNARLSEGRAEADLNTARDAQEKATVELAEAQRKAGDAAKELRRANAEEVKTKKALDKATRKLKAVPQEVTSESSPREAPVIPTGDVSSKSGQNESDGSAHGKRGEASPADEPTSEPFSGVLRLQVDRPVDYRAVTKLREQLGQIDGLVLKSFGGSYAEGPSVTVLVERPLPVLLQLSRLEIVERVSKTGKGFELKLKSF